MPIATEFYPLIYLGFFCIAFLYSSVGFGGGSSYLALLSLLFGSFFLIRSTALVCNLAVVTGSCWLYYKNGHLNFRQFLPFIITSVPMAFLGATFRLTETVFFALLGGALICSAVALLIQSYLVNNEASIKYPKFLPYVLGALIGLLSGVVGIGGGIFLAPVLNHLKWNKPIVIAALSSFFILVNSISGLSGLLFNGTFQVEWPQIIGFVAAVLIGGQLGVRLSIVKFSPRFIRLLTALLVLTVGIRLLIKYL